MSMGGRGTAICRETIDHPLYSKIILYKNRDVFIIKAVVVSDYGEGVEKTL